MKLSTKRFLNSCFKLLVNILGNTVGIWFAFLVIMFFEGMIPEISWPGINSFVYSGSLLIISFSFFTTVITTTYGMKFKNIYNILAIIGLVGTAIIYSKFIGLGGEGSINKEDPNILLIIPIILSVLLLFFTLKNRKKIYINTSWLKGAEAINKEYCIFLSFAIAGNKTKNQRELITKQMKEVEDKLNNLGYPDVFNACNYFSTEHDYQPPADAAREDFTAIENSKNFLLFYPVKVPSSALVELGYALRDGSNIVIFTKNRQYLPFLVRELSEINKNVRIVTFEDTAQMLSMLEENHTKYFKK